MTEQTTADRPWSLRRAAQHELAEWDALVQANPDGGQWTQGVAYARLKATERLIPRFLVLERGVVEPPEGEPEAGEDVERVYVLALEHRSLAGRFWYLPLGPGAAFEDLGGIAEAIRGARGDVARGVYAVKVEPYALDTEERRAALAEAGYRAANTIQQNVHTVLVDLTPTVEEIFAGFNKKLRNHIRNAEKHGYRVEKVEHSEATYEQMYALMQTVAGGKGVDTMKPYAYYHQLWSELCDRGQGHFWFGYDGAHEGPQASAFMIGFGRYALAKDGGSVPDRAIRGGAHLIRWTAMQWFKEHEGREVYDTYATPPSWRADDETHRMHGPGIFKRLFGPIVDHLPSHDLVLDQRRYALFLRLLLPIERRVRRRPWGIW